MKYWKSFLKTLTLIIIIPIMSCNDKSNSAPRPRGYFRISFPEKEYTRLDSVLPYKFEHPKYSKIVAGQTSKNEPYWINLAFPRFEAQIHFSYKKIDDNLYTILEDNREFAFKHTVKADAIQEKLFESSEEDVSGILYEIKGNTASPLQFYVTDSTRHFLRGSLYFSTVPNKDSIAPVLNFLKKDVIHIMETLSWKD